jgi:antitoxin component YwqK of YwqJK toxin-antitoxin module
MEALKLLRKRVIAAWKAEATLSPDERRLHSWQFVARQADIPYLVGKGDANTFYYSVNGGDVQYAMPDEMVDIMNSWIHSQYVCYAITKTRKVKESRKSTDLQALLKKKSEKFIGYYIVGIKADGKLIKLYQMKNGLMKHEWVKYKRKGK